MMRSALNRLDAHSETTVMVGDRMDTDIISGLEAGLRTVLVTTGSTRPDQVETYPYRPTRVIDSIADLVELAPGRSGRGGDVQGSRPRSSASATIVSAVSPNVLQLTSRSSPKYPRWNAADSDHQPHDDDEPDQQPHWHS